MNLFEKIILEVSSIDIEEYEKMRAAAQKKAKKDIEIYKQMESPMAQKMLSYIIGFRLVFNSKQEFTKKTKNYIVRALDDDRDNQAEIFANKYNTKAHRDGRTPTVDLDGYKFVFKDMKSVGGNKGNAFEREMFKALNKRDLDHNVVKEIVKELDINIDDIKEVIDRAGENTKRPLSVENGKIEFVGVTDIDQVGDFVSDIDLILKDGERIHMSLKDTPTTTFINAGIGTPGPDNPKMIAVFKALGADPDLCIQGFYDYGKTNVPKPKKEDFLVVRNDFKRILKFAMGSNFLYVHKKHIFYVDKAKNESMISNPRNFKIHYPGPERKRLDITFETNGFKKVAINVRPASGGLWPTRLHCDYNIRPSV